MYKENFAPRIKAKREELGLSQNEVAALTDIPQAKLSKIETGKQEPTLEDLGRLAQLYNTSLNWLLGVVTEQEPIPRKNVVG